MDLELGTAPSPLGTVHFALHEGALCAVGFKEGWKELLVQVKARIDMRTGNPPAASRGMAREAQASRSLTVQRCRRAFERYFQGDLTALDALPVDPRGTTFQERVWRALRSIPAGSTVSYAELARRVGRPSASRAVGAANGANPISLVLPCHRVIGANGRLVGYGGGMQRKEWLLRHEGALPAGGM